MLLPSSVDRCRGRRALCWLRCRHHSSHRAPAAAKLLLQSCCCRCHHRAKPALQRFRCPCQAAATATAASATAPCCHHLPLPPCCHRLAAATTARCHHPPLLPCCSHRCTLPLLPPPQPSCHRAVANLPLSIPTSVAVRTRPSGKVGQSGGSSDTMI